MPALIATFATVSGCSALATTLRTTSALRKLLTAERSGSSTASETSSLTGFERATLPCPHGGQSVHIPSDFSCSRSSRRGAIGRQKIISRRYETVKSYRAPGSYVCAVLAVNQRIGLGETCQRRGIVDDDLAPGTAHAIFCQQRQISRQVLRCHPQTRGQCALVEHQFNALMIALLVIGFQNPVRQPFRAGA